MQISSPNSVGYVFILLMVSFAVQNLVSISSHLVIFSFVALAFEIWSPQKKKKQFAKISTKGAYCISFILGYLWFQILHSSLKSILSLFLYMVYYSGSVSLFYLQLFSFPRIDYWREYPIPIMHSCLHGKLINHVSVVLFLSFLFCSIDLCLCFLYQYHSVLIAIVL